MKDTEVSFLFFSFSPPSFPSTFAGPCFPQSKQAVVTGSSSPPFHSPGLWEHTQAGCSFNPLIGKTICVNVLIYTLWWSQKRLFQPALIASHDKEVCEGPLLISAQMKGYFGQAGFLSLIQFTLDNFAQVLCTIFRYCWLRLSFLFLTEQK